MEVDALRGMRDHLQRHLGVAEAHVHSLTSDPPSVPPTPPSRGGVHQRCRVVHQRVAAGVVVND